MAHTKILYAEDNKPLRLSITVLLELEGWHVDACEDGATALSKLQTRTHYDLIFLDQDLPGLDGLQLTRHARTLPQRLHTPIVIISATDHATQARLAGADDFLQKPDDIRRIIHTLNHLLTTSSAK